MRHPTLRVKELAYLRIKEVNFVSIFVCMQYIEEVVYRNKSFHFIFTRNEFGFVLYYLRLKLLRESSED